MDRIIQYLVGEKHETEVVAKILAKTLKKYEDIQNGFLNWLDTREYSDMPVISGYSAKKIHDMQPDLDAAGVYQFMVTLRDNPQKAEEYIKSNFARK